MSTLGQNETFAPQKVICALYPKADITDGTLAIQLFHFLGQQQKRRLFLPLAI
jgi:hypothetical protein